MVDAVGGVAKIVGVALKIKEAASTVHQNKKDCHHIKSRVDILNRTLSHHEHNTELAEDSAVMAALEALDGILAEALEVITKCQEPRSIICVYYTAGNLSRKLSKVEQRISYLSSDVMLTIISYQLLRKGSAPHPPPQIYATSTHTALQPPSPPQKMSKQNQDGVCRKKRKRSRQTRTSIEVPKFGDWDADHPNSADGYTVIMNSCGHKDGRMSTENASTHLGVLHHPSFAPGPRGKMVGQPHSLVHRMAEVTRDIREAVETVLQNKGDCVEICKCANKVSTLLIQLEDTKMLDDPAMRGAMEKLLATFRRAHTLVVACQRRGLVPVWLSTPAARLPVQLHEVLDQIASNIADMTTIVLP